LEEDVVVRIELDLARPIAETFDYFSDFRNENEWNIVAHEIRLLTAGPIGKGSRFSGEYDRMGTMEYEIIEFDRPRHLLVRGRAKSFEWVSTFDFAAQADSTHVIGTIDPKPKGLFTLMKPVMEAIMKGQMLKGMGSLKRTLEAKPVSPEPTG
jgi:hypothetical protein